MTQPLIILLTTSALLFSGASLASTALSDTELASVSGGGIDPHLEGQSLPQEQQQPNSNNSSYTPPQPAQNNDGMELAPEVFTVMQSMAEVDRKRKLHMAGTTQQGAKALNLDNAVSSDAISTNNIFNGGDLTLDDVTTGIEINQLNNLNQLHRTQGSLSTSVAGYRYETITDSRSGSENYDYHVYSNIYQQRRSELLLTDYIFSFAEVGDQFTSPELTSDALLPPLEIISPQKFPRNFAFGPIGAALTDGWFQVGATLKYDGIKLSGPGLSINSIGSGGDENKDLILGTSVTIPKLDFGDFRIRGCLIRNCATKFWNLGFVGGDTITSELVLEGYAPEVQELNLGTGFAFDGNGQLATDLGSLTINGDVSIKVLAFAELTLDFSKLELLGVDVGQVLVDLAVYKDENGDGINILNYAWDFDVINKEFPFELLDETLEVEPIDFALGDTTHHTDEILNEDNDTIEIYNVNDVAESSLNESYEHTVLIGGQMTGAEAELLALSESKLTVDNSSTISMTGNTQQGMRIFSGVNAVSSVAANALNISRLPVMSGGASVRTQISMQQHNRFIQQR